MTKATWATVTRAAAPLTLRGARRPAGFRSVTAAPAPSPGSSHIHQDDLILCVPGAVDGADDPRMNPLAPGVLCLNKLWCERMLVSAALKDRIATRIRAYSEAVAASGTVAWLESEGDGHVFFLGEPDCENAKLVIDRIVAFIPAP